jgi:PIN domain nuclease of toxin-antitoxin system
MKLLLDTHAFLWYYSGSPNLSQFARGVIENPSNVFFTSMASLWEISIKNSLGKLQLDAPLNIFYEDIIDQGFKVLPIDISHILQAASLPFHHRDPFDRLLIGQALSEGMALISKDTVFPPYVETSGLQIHW